MIIMDIQHIKDGKTRTDDRYPQRIGCKVRFCAPPHPDCCMLLEYLADNQGNPKDGFLRTSLVKSFHDTANAFIVDTCNSRYILLKESSDDAVTCFF